MLNRFTDTSELSNNELSAFERPTSFSVEPLQKKFHLVVSRFPGEKALKKKEK